MAETPPPYRPNNRSVGEQNEDIGEGSSSLSIIDEDVKHTQEDVHNNNTQSQSEMLTQNDIIMTQNEMTQLGDDFEDYSQTFSPMPPSTPINPRNVPWGRLIPCTSNGLESGGDGSDDDHDNDKDGEKLLQQQRQQHTTANHHPHDDTIMPLSGGGIELFPKDPTTSKTPGSQQFFMGLSVKTSDKFNEYEVGRSQKCHVRVPKPPIPPQQKTKEKALTEWGYGMISNRHCRIFCMLKGGGTNNNNNSLDMEVYLEDTSGNGTLINNTTLLRKGEKRLLHTGDEICLINPFLLRKRVRSTELQNTLQRRHSFIFVNVYQQQGPLGGMNSATNDNRLMPLSAAAPQSSSSLQQHGLMPPPPSSSSTAVVMNSKSHKFGSGRRGIVDVKALHNHSFTPPIRSISAALAATPPPLPSPLGLESATKPEHQKQHPKQSQQQIKQQQIGGRKSPRRRQQQQQQQQHRRIEEYYDIRDVLGTGTCGEVRRAIHRRTGIEYAVKVISLGRGGRHRGPTSQMSTEAFEAEAAMLQALDHPYIVKLVDVFVDHHNRSAVYLIMELLQGGDLFDRIIQKGRYTEVESRRVMRRLLSAIYYLHEERDIVHRDLKPENILCVNPHPKDDITIKLTDFGLAKSVTEDGLKTFCGTPQYFAPEVLRRQHTVAGRGRYGKQADMWSLGVILYVLLSGTPPFDGAHGLDAVENARITFPATEFQGVSSQAIDLIRQLLLADPQKRISVKDACNHTWILTDDGDTHTHPLDDPVVGHGSNQHGVSSTTSNNVAAVTVSAVQEKEEASNKNENDSTEKDAVNEPSTIGKKVAADTKQSKKEENMADSQVSVPEISIDEVVDRIVKPTKALSEVDNKILQDASPPKNEANQIHSIDNKDDSCSHEEGMNVDTPDKDSYSESKTSESTSKKLFSPRMLNQQIEQFRKVVAKSVGTDGQSNSKNQGLSPLVQASKRTNEKMTDTVTPSPPPSFPASKHQHPPHSLLSYSVSPNDNGDVSTSKNRTSKNMKRGRHSEDRCDESKGEKSHEIPTKPNASTTTETNKTVAKSCKSDEGTKPVELTEDEICSQFSDEDSVSSFGTSTVGSDKPNGCSNLERIPSTSSSSEVSSSFPATSEHEEGGGELEKENKPSVRKRQKVSHSSKNIREKKQPASSCDTNNTKATRDKTTSTKVKSASSKKKTKNVSTDTKNSSKTTTSKSRRRANASSTSVKKKKTQTTLSSWFTNKKTWTAK